jgi:hypothetical protein
MREGTFSRHTVEIYFDKKGVLTIIQYTVGHVINSNWKKPRPLL